MSEKQRLEDKERRIEELNDLKTIISTPHGLRFFKRFFERGMIFASTYTGNSGTFFNEGRRALALEFMGGICEAAPETLPEIFIRKPIKEDE